MDFGSIANAVGQQFVTVWHAPIPFLAVVLLSWFVIWKIIQREFATRLANSDSTANMLREQLERTQASDTMAIAAGVQQLETVAEEPVSEAAKGAAPAPKEAAPKVYVREGMDAAYLLGMFEGRTELQGQELIKSEIGKWMVVEGPVKGVTTMTLGSRVMVALHAGEKHFVFCPFPEVTPELARLSDKDVVKIEGQIDRVMQMGVFLEECEIISVRRP